MARAVSDGPATSFTPLTPHNTNNVSPQVRAIYVGAPGDITVSSEDFPDTPILFKSVPAGTILPISPRRVMATGTTATNLIAIG